MKYFTFTLFSISIATAQLVKPVENDTLNYTNVYFEWEQIPSAKSYQIQVAENDSVGFQDPLIEQIDSTLLLIIKSKVISTL